jgi:hypothetical protein
MYFYCISFAWSCLGVPWGLVSTLWACRIHRERHIGSWFSLDGHGMVLHTECFFGSGSSFSPSWLASGICRSSLWFAYIHVIRCELTSSCVNLVWESVIRRLLVLVTSEIC